MNPLKQQLINIIIKFLSHDSVQLELNKAYLLRNVKNKIKGNALTPYSGFAVPDQSAPYVIRSIFITSRFYQLTVCPTCH